MMGLNVGNVGDLGIGKMLSGKMLRIFYFFFSLMKRNKNQGLRKKKLKI